MATFLDITALENFANIFVFLFVWLSVYAILGFTKILGRNQLLPILIGLLLAIFVLLSDLAIRVILRMVPWIILVFIFVLLMTVAIQAFAGGAFEPTSFGGIHQVLFIIIAITVIVATLTEVRQSVTVPGDNETSTDFKRDFSQTTTVLFHPSFLGMMFLLAIAIFTITLLAAKQT